MLATIEDLKAADLAYYNGVSTVSDAEYDASRDRLHRQFPGDPYWSTVGAPPPGHLQEVKLFGHMGSQSKSADVAAVGQWVSQMVDHGKTYNVELSLVMMDKLDGSSVEAVYLHGSLFRVATRGDGDKGSDITENARLWKGLPRRIAHTGTLVVRGEAMLDISDWEAHFPDTANPRNAANGTIMRKSDNALNRHITFRAFECSMDVGDVDSYAFHHKWHSHRLNHLARYGFKVVRFRQVAPHEVSGELSNWSSSRKLTDYEMDGVIIAVEQPVICNAIGYSDSGTRPRFQTAWKFPSVSTRSVVRDIVLTQGQTGAIIPTAQIEPVQCGGVTIDSVLLNNFDFISDLGLNIGDEVEVVRAGDVIPYISQVTQKRSEGTFPPPFECPGCGGSIFQVGRVHLCPDDQCCGRAFQRIKNWVTKRGVKFLGDAALDALTSGDRPLVGSIADLYRISAAQLADLRVGAGRLGESMARKIVGQLEASAAVTTDVFMGSLGIKFLGRSMARHVGFRTVEEWLGASVEDLAVRDNMGPNKAQAMHESIHHRRHVIIELMSVLEIHPYEKPQVAVAVSEGEGDTQAHPYQGKTFCFTGVRMKPDQAARFAAVGGIEKSGVSAGLGFLVQKSADSESSKSQKARSLDIPVIGFDEFLASLMV